MVPTVLWLVHFSISVRQLLPSEAFDPGLAFGVCIDRHVVAESLDIGLVAEPVIAVIVGIEDRNDRLVGELADLPYRHFADLQRGAGIGITTPCELSTKVTLDIMPRFSGVGKPSGE